jgi:hypothetical protein
MSDAGFEHLEPDKPWRFDPEEWTTLGITTEQGATWWKHRIGPGDALRWRRAGVSEPIDAVRWKIAGVSPGTVREWLYSEIDARQAVAWTELGFNAAGARKHKRAGRTPVQAYGREQRMYSAAAQAPPVPAPGRRGPGPHRFMETVGRRDPRILHSYMSRQWFDDEAIAWAVHGIEAAEAVAWKELGLTPVEAERQQQAGSNAMQTAKAWWQAGIPFDEVADSIGAGLTPQEATGQRAKGTTVERATVLRSLRKGDGPAR